MKLRKQGDVEMGVPRVEDMEIVHRNMVLKMDRCLELDITCYFNESGKCRGNVAKQEAYDRCIQIFLWRDRKRLESRGSWKEEGARGKGGEEMELSVLLQALHNLIQAQARHTHTIRCWHTFTFFVMSPYKGRHKK